MLNEERYGAIRILHVLDDFSVKNTGVSKTVSQIAGWQAKHFGWVGVHTVNENEVFRPDGVVINVSKKRFLFGRWNYPLTGLKGLMKICRLQKITHVHVHEFWRAGFIISAIATHLLKLPLILSAHGSTSPWALSHQGWLKHLKKQIYWKGFAHFFLHQNVHLHAITELEANHFELFFKKRAKLIIPNSLLPLNIKIANVKAFDSKKYFLFLGRLHPVKGVDIAIKAFSASVISSDWELLIAGPKEVSNYYSRLKKLTNLSSKKSRIKFLGPVYGEEKKKLVSSAWVVLVPSYSEVLAMVNLEAAQLKTPTITSKETGLNCWDKYGGVLIDLNAKALKTAIEDAANWSNNDRVERGIKISKYVVKQFNLEKIGWQWANYLVKVQKK
ncbi:glycosyltransferase [Candidatus Puniceispirillum sp.]|nr:glycosyltransferase [Candidatus Puniceispirillum sp.]